MIQLPSHPTILGAIAGDVIGSIYEMKEIDSFDFDFYDEHCRFTDDTILTVAVADCILHQKDYAKTIWEYGRKYPGRGFGGTFRKWLESEERQPYGSFGNGSAMRVSAVGFAYDDLDQVLAVAKQSAEVTHNHPEGIKGAQATAAAIFLARTGKSKAEIRQYIAHTFAYDLNFTIESLRPNYGFDVSCQGSVPQAIVAFLDSSDYENAIRLAISLNGDSDTIACIAGGIAAAYYKVVLQEILEFVVGKLDEELLKVVLAFEGRYS